MHENILDINSTNFQIDSPYYKKTFLITGSFSIPRSDIKEILSNKFDAQVRGTISKNVDFLLVGNNPTNSKIDTAKKLGITIIYNEF